MNARGHLLTRRQIVANVAAPPAGAGDGAQLHRLLAVEQAAIAVYGLASRSPDLTPRARALMSELGRQERAHAAALAALPGGVEPAPVLRTVAELEPALASIGIPHQLAAVHNQRVWFWLVEMLEHRLEGAYYGALAKLNSKPAALLAARILASEAQHATALYLRRDPNDLHNAVPAGLVQGTPLPRH